MTTNVNVDPLRAKAVFDAWGKVDLAISQGAIGRTAQIRSAGHDLLDGASFALLKAEFLAAQAGVVPFIPLPGGGQGVMTVGAALAQPKTRWPQAALADLYLLNHKNLAAIHANIRAARPSSLPLEVVPMTSTTWAQAQFWSSAAGPGSLQLGALPVAWIVLSAVGILATVATSYYATRTKVEQIQSDAHLLSNQHRIGALTEIAQSQLATTGKLDPSLIGAIQATGTSIPWTTWPYVAIGAGGLVAGAAGMYAVTKRRPRR